MHFSNIQDVMSPATLARITYYAKLVKKAPKVIIDRELNAFMDEQGEYIMQQLAMMDKKSQHPKSQKRKKQFERPICISSDPAFQAAAQR